MTNVPNNIRGLWTEIYTLFDRHFKMDTFSADAWSEFWDDGIKIYEKYGEIKPIRDLIYATGELIINYSRQG